MRTANSTPAVFAEKKTVAVHNTINVVPAVVPNTFEYVNDGFPAKLANVVTPRVSPAWRVPAPIVAVGGGKLAPVRSPAAFHDAPKAPSFMTLPNLICPDPSSDATKSASCCLNSGAAKSVWNRCSSPFVPADDSTDSTNPRRTTPSGEYWKMIAASWPLASRIGSGAPSTMTAESVGRAPHGTISRRSPARNERMSCPVVVDDQDVGRVALRQ